MCSLFHHIIRPDSGLAHFEELGISVVVCVMEIIFIIHIKYTIETYVPRMMEFKAPEEERTACQHAMCAFFKCQELLRLLAVQMVPHTPLWHISTTPAFGSLSLNNAS